MSSARALVSLLLVAGVWNCSPGSTPTVKRGGGLPEAGATSGGAIGSGGGAMGLGGKLSGSGGVMGGVGGTATGGKTGTGGTLSGGAGGTGGTGTGVGGAAMGGATTGVGGAAMGGATTGVGGAAMGGAATGGAATGGVPGTIALTTGLIGYWKFDEPDTTGGAIDSSGTNNNGTYSTAPTRSTAVPAALAGKSTACLTFNGTNNQVILPAVPAYGNWTAATSYSISAWVSVASFKGWVGIVANESAGNYCGLYVSNSSTFAFEANEITGGGVAAPATLNTWHHLTIVQDAANNIQRLYLDGTASAGSRQALACTTSAPFRFGTPDGVADPAGYFSGSIDDVRFYNRALNQAEINALANGQQ